MSPQSRAVRDRCSKSMDAQPEPQSREPRNPPHAAPLESSAGGLMRLWLATPDWLFRVMGAAFFLIYAASRMRDYADFPNIGPYRYEVTATGQLIPGSMRYFPIAKVLIDLTFLLIALSFAIRIPPRSRAAHASRIVIPLVAGFWPLAPFLLHGLLELLGSEHAASLDRLFSYGRISLARYYTGVFMLTVGNALDVWGYATLCRSLSIVAEARQLKTSGPYRYIRHPIYLGQFIAQAGFWLVLVELRTVWAIFYLLFVAMQLYRSRIEDLVLAEAFGDKYADYKRKTFWFV